MDVTFVHAPEDYYDQNYGTRFIPLWAYTLAAHLPDDWHADILDCRFDKSTDASPAEVFAFSGINQDLSSINQTWRILKEKYPRAIFVLGGPITWSFEQEGKLDLLNHFDYLFVLDGEESFPQFLNHVQDGTLDHVPQVICAKRFPLSEARKIRFDLLDGQDHRYYGAVIEVSRGCPFLCEFCDIRVLPHNNETHPKDARLIVEEMDGYYRRGIDKFQLACDNFIGDLQWAEECLDAMIEWRERTGAEVSLFTWLTINVYKMPRLLEKLRRAGFSILFIGVESVNRHSLLETAKVQNIDVLEKAIRTIHSYGFVIAPGFIFGFDSDSEAIFEQTLDFIRETGTVGGDPSFLTALAGTPLYERMRRSGRLVERDGDAIERKKIATNIRYLQDADELVQGFMRFVDGFTDAGYQYERFRRHIELLRDSERFIPVSGGGYASPFPYLNHQLSNADYRRMLLQRVGFLLRPDRLWAVLKAWRLMRRQRRERPGLAGNFFYWLYSWTNMAVKYKGLTGDDFALHSVNGHVDLAEIREAAEPDEEEVEDGRRNGVKVDIQRRYTQLALQSLGRGGAAD